MDIKLKEELLKNPMVIDEIKRHRWFESEKANRDIGYDAAAKDWLDRFAQAWIDYHMPHLNKTHKSQVSSKKIVLKPKKRSAKSYI